MASRKVLILVSSIALLDMSVMAMPPLEAPPEHRCDHSSGGSDADQVSLVQLKSVAKIRRKDTRTSTLSSSKITAKEVCEAILGNDEELDMCVKVLTALNDLPKNPSILEIGGGNCRLLAQFAGASNRMTGRTDISVFCTDIHTAISEEPTLEDYGSLQYVRVDNSNSGQLPGTQTIRDFALTHAGRFQLIVAQRVLCVCDDSKDVNKKTIFGDYIPGIAYKSCGAVDMSVDSVELGSIASFLQSIETMISKDQHNAVNGRAILFPVEDCQGNLEQLLSRHNDDVDGEWVFRKLPHESHSGGVDDHHMILSLQSPSVEQ